MCGVHIVLYPAEEGKHGAEEGDENRRRDRKTREKDRGKRQHPSAHLKRGISKLKEIGNRDQERKAQGKGDVNVTHDIDCWRTLRYTNRR